jgi:large conductance mechanosensitive channel
MPAQGGTEEGAVLKDLKKFLLRGNVIDLAVAVIIGIAFGVVVSSLVNDVIMAVIGAVLGKPNFNALTFALGDGVVRYGRFITAVVNFLIIGTVLFVLVRTAELFFSRAEKKPTEVDLLTEIRDELRRQNELTRR